MFVLTVPFPSSDTDFAAKAKTVFTPVMGMGRTRRAPWAIGTHTSMLLHSIPYCYEVLIEEKHTSGQEPQCRNEGEKMKSRGRFCIFWGFVSGLLIYLSMGIGGHVYRIQNDFTALPLFKVMGTCPFQEIIPLVYSLYGPIHPTRCSPSIMMIHLARESSH